MKVSLVKICNSVLPAALAWLTACAPQPKPLNLQFDLQQAAPADTELSVYVHDLQVQTSDGEWLALELADPQQPVALIHLSRTRPRTLLATRVAQRGPFKGLRFELGVPEQLNHANPLTAAYPLNDSGMLWSWQQGYKFLRLDARSPNGGKWAFHLGSTGCVSPSSLRPPEQPCSRPNRVSVRLADFNPEQQQIVVDVSVLHQRVMQHEAVNCTMNYQLQPVCIALLTTLALDANTGKCIDECKAQTLFKVRAHE